MPPVAGPVDNAVRILITGFGPFGQFKENPSWLAVKPLHGQNLQLPAKGKGKSRPVHITTVNVMTEYDEVLKLVPGFHARPPTLPPPTENLPSIPPPEEGYHVVLHVGVAGPTPIHLERGARRLGYQWPDNRNRFAPEVKDAIAPTSNPDEPLSKAQARERDRLNIAPKQGTGQIAQRGFGGEKYGHFPDELGTSVDVDTLVDRVVNLDKAYAGTHASTDAGLYLCEFIYYCSLAEAKRTADNRSEYGDRDTRVLFLHCPPVAQPLNTVQVTKAIKEVVLGLAEEVVRA